MTLPDSDEVTQRLHDYLHVDEAHTLGAAAALGYLATDGDGWLYITGLLAITAGSDIRRNFHAPGHGFYGLDPEEASRHETAVVVANQLVAAAANSDQELLRDLLTARLNAAVDAGPRSIEQQTCARILSVTMLLARTLHRQWCPELPR